MSNVSLEDYISRGATVLVRRRGPSRALSGATTLLYFLRRTHEQLEVARSCKMSIAPGDLAVLGDDHRQGFSLCRCQQDVQVNDTHCSRFL